MLSTLNSLKNHFNQFARTNNGKLSLRHIEWVNHDPDVSIERILFEKENKLILTKGNTVEVGNWSIVAGGRSVLLEIENQKSLFKAFVQSDLLFLIQDNSIHDDNPGILWFVNQAKIGNSLQIDQLRLFLNKALRVYTIQLSDGSYLASNLHRKKGILGQHALINGEAPKNGVYRSLSGEYTFEIANQKVKKIY
jgi:hypothetical protein